jgi:enoyl-CoA hydratase
LVNRVVPRANLMSTAVQWAERLARNSAVAVQTIKQAVLQGADLPTSEAFALETALARQVFAHPDAQEGLQAFSQKRAPRYIAEGNNR